MPSDAAIPQAAPAQPAILSDPADAARFNTAGVVTVSFAHFVHDTYSAYFAPLLPILIQNLGLTKTAAGILWVFYNLPSLFQPVIGHLGDRVNLRILVALAPGISAVLMTLLGIAPGYGALVVILLITGASSAGLHAIGPVIGGLLSGNRLGRGMSYWMVGGELGRTVGPLIVVAAVNLLTPAGLPWLALGGIGASIFLLISLRTFPDYRPAAAHRLDARAALAGLRPLLPPLLLVIATRSLLFSAITTFLPTFLTEEGANLWLAGASLSILEAAGVLGAMSGGVLSDRLGRRAVMIIVTFSAPIFILLFLQTRGWLQFPMLLFSGFTLLSTMPVMMAMAQEQTPQSRALANGIFMAMNFVISSLAVLIVGILADAFGLRTTIIASAVLMLVGAPAAFFLPDKIRRP